MKLVSVTNWVDFEDEHYYREGESYPFDGREIPEERIAELSGSENKAGFPLIKAVEAPSNKKPKKAEETPEKGV